MRRRTQRLVPGHEDAESVTERSHGKKEASETVMFSGLETQSEISRLLDELYGRLDRVPLGEMAGRERCTSLQTAEYPKGVQGRAREGERRLLHAKF